jgi:hypothetical protein
VEEWKGEIISATYRLTFFLKRERIDETCVNENDRNKL